jgi:hypothetical protein
MGVQTSVSVPTGHFEFGVRRLYNFDRFPLRDFDSGYGPGGEGVIEYIEKKETRLSGFLFSVSCFSIRRIYTMMNEVIGIWVKGGYGLHKS